MLNNTRIQESLYPYVVLASEIKEVLIKTYSGRSYLVSFILKDKEISAARVTNFLTTYFQDHWKFDVDSLNRQINASKLQDKLTVIEFEIIKGFKYDVGGNNFA